MGRVLSRSEPPGVHGSWERQPWALRILRGFLGITFMYAGAQKFADPNFLRGSTPDYIGNQLKAFAQGSPVRPLLMALAHAPALVGVGIALLELAIGLATLLGVAPITSALAGAGVNVLLFLSATWHVHPYFLGSDSMYAVGWLAFAAGLIEQERRSVRARPARRRSTTQDDVGRREFVRGATVAAGTVVLGAAAAALAGKPVPAASAASTPPSSARATGTGGGSAPAQGGTTVARLDSIPVGGAIGFNDPSQGQAILVRLGENQVVAFSRTCTHAGCPVGYNPQAHLIVCPCHGAEFDPAKGAAVVAGPAPAPLSPIKVLIEKASGQIIVES